MLFAGSPSNGLTPLFKLPKISGEDQTNFGGIDTYRKTTPLFLGLALGDITMILFWLMIDGWQGRMGHHLTPD